MWLASVVMRNRFRAAAVVAAPTSPTAGAVRGALLRPRCSQRPLLWKDRFILGGGPASRSWWMAVSLVATMGVLLAAAYGNSFPVGMIALGVAPWIIAFQFDGLMTAEFREQTWSSLMLLPIDPRQPVLSKLYAAIWERRAIALPVVLAAVLAARTSLVMILMALAIATLGGLMLIEISILSQFNRKLWWAGPMVGAGVIVLIGILISFWIIFPPVVSFVITIATMIGTVTATYAHIHSRLRNWSEA
jgi:hypothetical protein